MSLVLLVSASQASDLQADDEAPQAVVSNAVSSNSDESKEKPGYMRIIDSWSTSPDEVFRPAAFQEAGPANVAAPIFQDNTNRGRGLFGSPSRSRSLLSANRRSLTRQPGTNVVLGTESKGRKTTDIGQLLGKSTSSIGIATEKRSPIVTDVRVRGTQVGQLLAWRGQVSRHGWQSRCEQPS